MGYQRRSPKGTYEGGSSGDSKVDAVLVVHWNTETDTLSKDPSDFLGKTT